MQKPDFYTLYSITCSETNKVYIGVCTWYAQRKCKHISDLCNNKHLNYYLQEDFNKYGIYKFHFDIIQRYKYKNDALIIEKYYTDVVFKLNKEYCYNILSGGADVQEQITKRQSLKLLNDEGYRSSISNIRTISQIGRKYSEESKSKMSISATGRKATDETKNKMSEMRKGSGGSKAKKVIDNETGIIYGSLKEAAESIGIKYDTVRARLNGYNNQKTNLRWL